MRCIISYHKPIDEAAWNSLCQHRHNLVQSTHYESVEAFYPSVFVYFQIVGATEQLLAGVKFSLYENKRKVFAPFSRRLVQFGEMIFDDVACVSSYHSMLTTELNRFLHKEKIVQYITKNFYGNYELLVKPQKYASSSIYEFNVAFVDLKTENLLSAFNRNTRRNIKKSERNNLAVSHQEEEVNRFLDLVEEIYRQQNWEKEPPNFDYIRFVYEQLPKNMDLVFCKKENELLSAVLNMSFGNASYSLFGGTIWNEYGSGHYMYFQLMLALQRKGVERYYLGEVARRDDKTDPKFSVGISGFKRGFNCEEIPSEKITYTLKPVYQIVWDVLLNINRLIRRFQKQ